MRRKLLFLMLIVLSSGVLSTWETPTFACTATPAGNPSYTFEDKVRQAETILEGTVTATSGTGFYDATVQVARYFKGSGPDVVTIKRFGSSAGCLADVRVGSTYIFYAIRESDTTYHAFYMSAGAAIEPVTNASKLIAMLGQPVLPNDSPAAPGYAPLWIIAAISVILSLWLLLR